MTRYSPSAGMVWRNSVFGPSVAESATASHCSGRLDSTVSVSIQVLQEDVSNGSAKVRVAFERSDMRAALLSWVWGELVLMVRLLVVR